MKITNSENSESNTSLTTNPNKSLGVTELYTLDDFNDDLIQEVLEESNRNSINDFTGLDEVMVTSWLTEGLEELKSNEVKNCLRFIIHIFIM